MAVLLDDFLIDGSESNLVVIELVVWLCCVVHMRQWRFLLTVHLLRHFGHQLFIVDSWFPLNFLVF